MAGPLSPPKPCVPLPATVVITPFETLRMRLFIKSAMKRSPAESTVTPEGRYNWALVAGPLSPLKPCRPVSRHGGDHAVRDLADAVVVGVGDVEVAGGVHRDAAGAEQLGAGGRAVVAAEA